MAGTVVDLTLQTIRDLLVEEVKFLSGVGGQVKDVQSELQRMQNFLVDVDRRKFEEHAVRNFVREIRNLSYRIEDIVETYAAEVLVRRRKKDFKNILNRLARLICECKNVHEVGLEIAAVKSDISNLISSMEVYGIRAALEKGESGRQRGSEKWSRQTYAHEIEEDFVGMENDTNLLVPMLLDDKRMHRIVSIYGMGGLGKSTLAKKIFHHEEIRREFKRFAWVCVSQECNPKIVFQDLLKQFLPMEKEQIMAMGESELVEEVYKMLKEQKCLVVVDDIWHVEDWQILCHAFPTAETQSKILITTRMESVAKVGIAHPLSFLTEDEGWELLQKKAFKLRDPEDLNLEAKTLEHLGRKMVQKCGYLPLAISVVGGILSQKDSSDAWEIVNKNIDLYISRGNGNERYGGVRQVLSLSYDDLPYHLKPCFLYLSNFPEDQNIEAEELYMLWIAEGIVSLKDQEKKESLMDVAQRYLGELANRSMVQVQVNKILAPEKFKSFQLHDLLRDTCVAKSNEEEFLDFIDFRGGQCPAVPSHSSTSTLRRLAIYMDQNIGNVSFTRESTQYLRSLLFYVSYSNPPDTQPLDRVIDFKNLKFLRVLKFENVNFQGKTLPEELGNLIHLRFLGFRGCYLTDLPSCIGDLPFLQTLDLLLSPSQSCKIPNVIQRMKRLRYLCLPYRYVTEGKLVFFGLDELEILEGFNSKFCDSFHLSGLKSLRRLKARIYGNDNLSKFIDCIEVNRNIRLETDIWFYDCNFSSEEGKILLRKVFLNCTIQRLVFPSPHGAIKLPEYELGFLPNLTELQLCSGSEVLEDPMATLENLPKLRFLCFRNVSIIGEDKKMVCHAGGFPQLRSFWLRCKDLKKWTVEEGAMSCLLELELRCPDMEMIPEGIRFITTLKKLDISGMPDEFKNRILEGGEDYDKVPHINSIIT